MNELEQPPCGLGTESRHNGACGALAELFAGHGVQDQSFGYQSFNFGFGGGIVLHSPLVRGARGNAGEIGKVFTNAQMKHRPALPFWVD
nr:ROK family protein [Sinorhizobium medicae]